VYHLAGSGAVCRYEWAKEILRLDPDRDQQIVRTLEPVSSDLFPTSAERPMFSGLECTQFADTFLLQVPDWQNVLVLALDAA